MDFTGKKVIHKIWDEGLVISHNHPYFQVQFANEVKTLVFPDAFKCAVAFANIDEQYELLRMIEQKEQEDAKKRETWTIAPTEKSPTSKKSSSTFYRDSGSFTRPNIVFKCNFCDGGSNKKHIGYMGACSDEVIRYNIEVARHSWCSDPDCPCNQYYYGELDGHTLDEMCKNGGFACYESKMLKEWTAAAGTYLTKDRKMVPKKIRNVQMNSLAILTTRFPHANEDERFVFGVFLVTDADEGNSINEGFVRSFSKYRIELSPQEAPQIKFWNYHANDTKPERPVWGQGLYRYADDVEAVQILRDIVNVKQDPREKKFAEEFLQHFCKINKISLEHIPTPSGALKR